MLRWIAAPTQTAEASPQEGACWFCYSWTVHRRHCDGSFPMATKSTCKSVAMPTWLTPWPSLLPLCFQHLPLPHRRAEQGLGGGISRDWVRLNDESIRANLGETSSSQVDLHTCRFWSHLPVSQCHSKWHSLSSYQKAFSATTHVWLKAAPSYQRLQSFTAAMTEKIHGSKRLIKAAPGIYERPHEERRTTSQSEQLEFSYYVLLT